MAKLRPLLLAVFAFCLLITGCAKSVEGETQRWESNVSTVNALSAKYPGMKPALEARLASAKATFDSAASQADDAKIKTLSAANNALMTGFVTDLNELDKSLAKLRESRVEAASMAGDESSRLAAKVAAEDAAATIKRVEKTLETGAKDEASAKAIVDQIKADIATAQKAVDKVLEGDKKKADAAADKAATDKADADKAAADKKAETAEWVCKYCDAHNKHDATSCASCGAAKP